MPAASSEPRSCCVERSRASRWHSNILERATFCKCALSRPVDRATSRKRALSSMALVARAGFEPAISGLKGRRPSPLDERALPLQLNEARAQVTAARQPSRPPVRTALRAND